MVKLKNLAEGLLASLRREQEERNEAELKRKREQRLSDFKASRKKEKVPWRNKGRTKRNISLQDWANKVNGHQRDAKARIGGDY